jgi:hypothetical protein
MASKPLKLPTEPKALLAFVLQHYFDGSPLKLANAAGLSRAFINQWSAKPMRSRVIMYEHILVALETELAAAKVRSVELDDAKWAMKHLISEHNHAIEAKIRKESGR